MTAFLVTLAFIAVFFLGRASVRRPALATPVVPASLESHVATLREVLAAANELTPETEAWLVTIQSPMPQLPAGRPKLTISHPEFVDDYGACTTPGERGDVIKRWHRLGYCFDLEMRAWCLKNGVDSEWRNELRAMFDEQDKNS